MEEILAAFLVESEPVIRELRLLVESLFLGDALAQIVARFPQLHPPDTFVNVEVPSYLIENIRKLSPATTPEVLKHIDQNRSELLRTCFVDDAIIGMLIRDRSLITQPEAYLPIFWTHGYPLFERASPLFTILIARSVTVLHQIEPTLATLADACWALPSGLLLVSIFYRALLKGTERAELHEFEIVQRVFLANPIVENSQPFAASLRAAMPFCDIPILLQRYVLGTDCPFVTMFLVIVAFLRGWSDAETRSILDLLERGSPSFPKRSRSATIAKFAAHAVDLAFLLALAETDDQAVIDHFEGALAVLPETEPAATN
jgi:hypothetical protein